MIFKIILIGDPKVGKTTLRRSFMGKKLEKNYIQSLGVDFSIYREENSVYQIWDIVGEADRHTTHSYLEGTGAAVVMFDVMNNNSLENCKNWISLIFKNLNRSLPIVLVGNKVDLRIKGNGIMQDMILSNIEQLRSLEGVSMLNYIETSALNGENVPSVFKWLFTELTSGEENQ